MTSSLGTSRDQSPGHHQAERNTAEGSLPTATQSAICTWHDLALVERLAIFLMLAVITVAAVPRLPVGICHGDSGGFQLAAATLGITHPPGYAGYVSLWFLLTRVFGGDPAYVVSVSCLVAGLGVLALLALFQFRLGVNIWIAGAVCLALTAHPRIWSNLVAPEVYMVSLLFVAASSYLILRYAARGRRADLFVAAFLFGVAAANRLPAILLLPFIIAAWWIARRRWETGLAPGARSLALCAALTAVPLVYNLAYLWIRDTPETVYNYIEQYNADTPTLPLSTDGWRAQWRRVVWQHSGEQFRDLLIWDSRGGRAHSDWQGKLNQLRGKLRWIVQDLLPDQAVSLGMLWVLISAAAVAARRRIRAVSVALTAIALTAALVFLWSRASPEMAESKLAYQIIAGKWLVDLLLVAILLLAAILTLRRHMVAGILLIGAAVSCIAFVSIYGIHGLAADLLPAVFVAAVLVGFMLAPVFPQRCSTGRAVAAALIMALLALVTLVYAPQRHSLGQDEDAAEFLAQVDMAALPDGAVICSMWGTSTPLWYARLFLTPRPDIFVVNAAMTEWERLTRPLRHRPIYVTDPITGAPFWPGGQWQQERKLWRLVAEAR